MNDFIKQQQELAREKHPVDNFYGHHIISPEDLDTLITQIIQNTGEELQRLATNSKAMNAGWDSHELQKKGIEIMEWHITNVTGVE